MFKSTKLACVFVLCLAAVLVLASCGQDSSGSKTHYVPSDALTTEGDDGLSIFWDVSHWASQIVYEETYLDGMPVGATIVGMRIRLGDNGLGGGSQDAFVADTIEKFEVRLSSSEHGPGTLSDIFADNRGSDEVIVIPETSWEIAADDYENCDGICEFGPLISFANPFVYAGGDLLMEVAQNGGTNVRYADAETQLGTVHVYLDLSADWDAARSGAFSTTALPYIAFVYTD